MERPTTDAAAPGGSGSGHPVSRPADSGGAPTPRAAGGHPAFLPSDVDPTVFDEDFLRRLERLAVLVRKPVRGGLKGGRRSVKRGQSVEFADYRDYTLGDDLRQLDWNVYARLEKLFVKLFIEEEDLTVTFLVDGSASMAHGFPDKLVFAKRAAAALGYIALAAEDRVVLTSLAGRTGRRRAALRGSGRAFRLLAELSAIRPAEGVTDLVAACRHTLAQVTGRGVIVLVSDLLDPGADRALRDLAGTGSEVIVLHVLAPDEMAPTFDGDLRLVDAESGARVDVTLDLAARERYTERVEAWQAELAALAAKRRIAYVPLTSDVPLADLVFAELRRRRVVG
jgi:uncharacterized protein (DUF58 family)